MNKDDLSKANKLILLMKDKIDKQQNAISELESKIEDKNKIEIDYDKLLSQFEETKEEVKELKEHNSKLEDEVVKKDKEIELIVEDTSKAGNDNLLDELESMIKGE